MKLAELDYSTAQTVLQLKAALADGRLNGRAPFTTAREVANALWQTTDRRTILNLGDLLTRLGAPTRGRGAAPHNRSVGDVKGIVRRYGKKAASVQPPTLLSPRELLDFPDVSPTADVTSKDIEEPAQEPETDNMIMDTHTPDTEATDAQVTVETVEELDTETVPVVVVAMDAEPEPAPDPAQALDAILSAGRVPNPSLDEEYPAYMAWLRDRLGHRVGA